MTRTKKPGACAPGRRKFRARLKNTERKTGQGFLAKARSRGEGDPSGYAFGVKCRATPSRQRRRIGRKDWSGFSGFLRISLVYGDERARRTVIVDPLGVVHLHADAAVRGAGAERADGSMTQRVGILLIVEHRVEHDSADDDVAVLCPAVKVLEVVPPSRGAARGPGTQGRGVGFRAGRADHALDQVGIFALDPLVDVDLLILDRKPSPGT